MEKKENDMMSVLIKVVFVAIIFLFIVMIGLLIYYLNTKKSDNNVVANNEKSNVVELNTSTKNEVNNNKNSSNNNNNNKSAKPNNKQDITTLYNYVYKGSYEKVVYQSYKVTNENIDNTTKLLTIFNNLSKAEADEKEENTEYLKSIDSNAEIGDEDKYIYKYKKEKVEQKLNEIFGPDATIEHASFSAQAKIKVDYKNGIYSWYKHTGSGYNTGSYFYKMIKSNKEGNNLYIYDKYVYGEVGSKDNDGNYYYNLYETPSKEKEIEKNVKVDKNDIGSIMKTYGDKIKTFKHTYVTDSNGNYYWVSTEIDDI